MLLLSIVAFFGAEIKTFRDFPVVRVETRAGSIFTHKEQAAGYKVLENRTKQGDWIIDLPYGGGLTFAAKLRSAVYSAAYRIVDPGPEILQRDLSLARSRDPKLVLWEDVGGIDLGRLPECTIPYVVWKPKLKTSHTEAPVYDWVRSSYKPVAVIIPGLSLLERLPRHITTSGEDIQNSR